MVGYLLGLGDRHPSNLMIHRNSGKVRNKWCNVHGRMLLLEVQ